MFTYHLPTIIHFGLGESKRIAEHTATLTPGKVLMVVSDPGVERAGLVDGLAASLEAAGYTVVRFNQVAPNPRDADCLVGAQLFKSAHVDAVIGIGGGSAMDTAKAIALLGPGEGTPADYADGLRAYGQIAPILCIPTTAGTGSEVTRSAVITTAGTHRKLTLKHPTLRPKIALLDPLLTVTAPASVTTATGVDALVHAIEGTTCTLSTPITRAYGMEAMRTIVAALPKVFADGQNVEARQDMLTGSLLAGLCFGSSDVAAVHCLAEALGGIYDTPHGVANAIFLPEVLRYNSVGNIQLHASLSRNMGFSKDLDSDETAVKMLLTGIKEWTTALEIPTLRDLGYVRREDFSQLVELAFLNNSTPSNVRPITRADYAQILEAVYA